jgi:hypothetical protein
VTTTSENERIAGLLAAATPEAAAELRDLAETTQDKETRKVARKALYLLSQRHITPPERSAEAATPTSPTTGIAASIKAYASAYDGAGNRAIYLFYTGPNGSSPIFLQFLTGDEEGIRDIGVSKVSRREVADLVRQLEAQLETGVAFAEVENDYAIHLLHAARAINQRLRTQTPPGTLEWLARLPMPTGDYSTPPVYTRLSVAGIQADPNAPYNPHELFLLRWFDPWFLDVMAVEPFLDQLLTVSGEDQSEEVRRAEAAQATAEVVDALMVTRVRDRYIRYLEETADILLRRGLEAEARQALYHAIDLKSDRPASQIPFAERLVERTIVVALTMQMQGAPQDIE